TKGASVGNANSRRPDHERHRLVLRLRERGLTLAEIARRLGVTKQAVSGMLARLEGCGRQPRFPVRCRECDRLIGEDGAAPQNSPVYCLDCLAGVPDVTFGQRLKAHRLAAKLTQKELARRTGLHHRSVIGLERNRNPPDWPTLTQLLAVFGLRLLQ